MTNQELAADLRKTFREAEAQALKSFLTWLEREDVLKPGWDTSSLVSAYQDQRPQLPPSKQEAEERLDQHGLVTPCPTPEESIPGTRQAANSGYTVSYDPKAREEVQRRFGIDDPRKVLAQVDELIGTKLSPEVKAPFDEIVKALRLKGGRREIVWAHQLPNDNSEDNERTYLVGLRDSALARWVIL